MTPTIQKCIQHHVFGRFRMLDLCLFDKSKKQTNTKSTRYRYNEQKTVCYFSIFFYKAIFHIAKDVQVFRLLEMLL